MAQGRLRGRATGPLSACQHFLYPEPTTIAQCGFRARKPPEFSMNPQIAEILGRVAGGIDLTMAEMQSAMDLVMSGQCSDEEIGLLLTGLAAKGETVEELAGAA